jgi:hypothetical protein
MYPIPPPKSFAKEILEEELHEKKEKMNGTLKGTGVLLYKRKSRA